MKQIIIIILAVVMGLLVAMELGLRSLFGFGNPLIQDKTISSLLMNSLTIRRKSPTEFGTPNQWWDIRREKPKSFSTNT
ncbi:MAG: hypothetical protein RLZZ176_1926, partial [Cyanobacteriota bacterium]